jgi:hypothetical protein
LLKDLKSEILFNFKLKKFRLDKYKDLNSI